MGSQIACEYAIGGHFVTVASRTPAAARDRVDGAFDTALRAEIVDESIASSAKRRLLVVDALSSVVETPELVVESIVEDETAKGALLHEVAHRWPRATIASNTSSLSINALGRLAKAENRVLGTHYWNPPLLMPLVEVVAGDNTEPQRLDEITETLRSLGKHPVLVTKDVPGFVWNRLQFALLREAAWIVEEGIATAEVVDEIVRDGLARRWRYTGPFETMALGGAETFQRVAANLFPVLSNATAMTAPDEYLNFSSGELAAIQTRRDDGLRHDLKIDRLSMQELRTESA
jgi:3-hydroxybutyryl-CoA dehydrogenase